MVMITYLNSGFTINAAGFDAEMVTESSQLKSKPCMDFDAAKASTRWNWYHQKIPYKYHRTRL